MAVQGLVRWWCAHGAIVVHLRHRNRAEPLGSAGPAATAGPGAQRACLCVLAVHRWVRPATCSRLETEARLRGVGVWSTPGGITRPWDVRRGGRGRISTTGQPTTGQRYRCSEIGSHAMAQQLLAHGHSTLDGDGDREGWFQYLLHDGAGKRLQTARLNIQIAPVCTAGLGLIRNLLIVGLASAHFLRRS